MNIQPASPQRDPVCGMTVDPARAAATHDHGGKTYYFCCRGGKEKFRAEPEKYLKPNPLMSIAPATPPYPHGAPHAHVTLPAAPPVPVRESGGGIEYTCPMHSEVV